ncbi:hypothetical protein F2P58_02875 [Vibrio fortis]|uniref:Uncharacterized protein n=1 Tax=Vibrio fortis TaxID=212667 RepID=A0A5N3RD46_9VIBR|nr:hypothetical protein [Vibrio fortis]KAB0292093.1 hypothetical protein F2P58_02875 [Vibrio fortis]
MSKVEIPKLLLPNIGAEMKMDVHWVDVKLDTGVVHHKMVVRGGCYLAGYSSDKNGEGAVPFKSTQIVAIRRHKLVKWWPFW